MRFPCPLDRLGALFPLGGVSGYSLGLSFVGGSILTKRGEIEARESVGGTPLEKTQLFPNYPDPMCYVAFMSDAFFIFFMVFSAIFFILLIRWHGKVQLMPEGQPKDARLFAFFVLIGLHFIWTIYLMGQMTQDLLGT